MLHNSIARVWVECYEVANGAAAYSCEAVLSKALALSSETVQG
ncbi:MAG: hypothetical protein RJA70_2771 [Pseudomonadota bacterium]|jgi:hypothetical protein